MNKETATSSPSTTTANSDRLQAFRIVFDDVDDGEILCPGEELHGHVKVVVLGETRFTRLHVSFKGEASTNTAWLHKGGTDLTPNDCGASETYFNEDLTLFDGGRCLEAGSHRFPFKFIVPCGLNLPESFEGDHGHVSYLVAAKLDRFLYAKKPFNVVGEQRMVLDRKCLLSALVIYCLLFCLEVNPLRTTGRLVKYE